MRAGFVNQDLGFNTLWALKNIYQSEPALDLDSVSPIVDLIFQLYSVIQRSPNYVPVCMEAVNLLRCVMTNNPSYVFGDFMNVFVKAVPLEPVPMLQIIGDLILEKDGYAHSFVHHGGLQMAKSVLDNVNDINAKKEVFWILGNSCTASNLASRKSIEEGLIPYAIATLSAPQPVANEAGWVIVETVKLCDEAPALASAFLHHGAIQGIFNLLFMAISPVGGLTENSMLLISQALGAVYTLFNHEPEKVRTAFSLVVSSQDLQSTTTVEQLFSILKNFGNHIIANNALVLYTALKGHIE
jgi:hypothetical protein